MEDLPTIKSIKIIRGDDEIAKSMAMAKEIEQLRQQVEELVELMQATVDYTGVVVSTNNFYFAPTPKATGGE